MLQIKANTPTLRVICFIAYGIKQITRLDYMQQSSVCHYGNALLFLRLISNNERLNMML